MPKKKGKKKGGKGKKKAAKLKAAAEREEAMVKCKLFMKAYQTHCAASDSSPSPKILKACRESVEEDKSLCKFVLESEPGSAPLKESRSAKGRPKSGTAGGASTSAAAEQPPATPPAPPPIILPPLFKALTEASYNYMRCLHVWGIPVNDDGAVSIALFLESYLGVNLKVLELRTTDLSSWAIVRLARPIGRIQLTQLNLDYNEISCDVLTKLCEKLQANLSLQSLSLNFCKLDHTCGEVLGGYITVSQLKYLSLVGNNLQCNGCNELIRPMVSICESSSFNAIKLDTDGVQLETDESAPLVSSVGEPSTSKQTTLPPLARLDLRDNCIDPHGACGGDEVQTFEPVICMRTVKRWMISSPFIEDVNLDHNLIGDGGARELLQGLILRKEAGLPIMKLTVTVYISQETFQKIVEYSTPKKKKKKGKGKKKKK